MIRERREKNDVEINDVGLEMVFEFFFFNFFPDYKKSICAHYRKLGKEEKALIIIFQYMSFSFFSVLILT